MTTDSASPALGTAPDAATDDLLDPNAPLPRVLDDAQVEQFHRDGYTLIKNALDKDEAAHYRRVILDLLPDDLTVPMHWHTYHGRLKPMNPDDNHTMDQPELIPLMANPKLYLVMVQLFGERRLRAFDGSLGITMRDAGGGDKVRSQNLHIDASVPEELDNFLFTPEEVQLGGCYYLTDVEPDGGGIHVVPGGHRIVEEEARADPRGRHLHNKWKLIEHLESVEVTGEAGDFALLHHLMPHGASYNRRPTARVAQFMRYVRVDHAHGGGDHRIKPEDAYSAEQLAAMSPLARRLLRLDPWDGPAGSAAG